MEVVPANTMRFQQLQKELMQLQGFRAPLESERLDLGLGIINDAFPNQTFPLSAVHEWISHTKEDAAATTGFIAGLLKTLMCKGACLWVSTRNTVYPPALRFFGLLPDQVIFVNARNNTDALWVIEEGLKCTALSAVVGEIKELGFTESRRLQLAVEQSHVTGLIHRSISGVPGNVACVSRWRISSLKSIAEEAMPGVGFPQWSVALEKMRNGKTGLWQVAWRPQGFVVEAAKTIQESVPVRKTG